MAKTAKTAAPAAKKSAVAAVAALAFGEWINTVARARGDVAELVKTMREDKKLTDKSNVKRATELHGKAAGFDTLVARYALFSKRGTQAGRTRKAA